MCVGGGECCGALGDLVHEVCLSQEIWIYCLLLLQLHGSNSGENRSVWGKPPPPSEMNPRMLSTPYNGLWSINTLAAVPPA